jgi:hypothetical protein
MVFLRPAAGVWVRHHFPNPNVIMSNNPTPSVRLNGRNLDHHIYNNNGTWWIHYTVHLADYTKRRIRASLKTNDNLAARQRRDEALTRLLGLEGGIAA